MTIGDILGIIAGVTTVCVSVWSLLIGGTLFFSRRTATAQTRLETAPLRALGIGALLAAIIGAGGVTLLNQPNGLLKLCGWAMLLAMLAVGALGGSGLALLASDPRAASRYALFGVRCAGARRRTFGRCRFGAAAWLVYRRAADGRRVAGRRFSRAFSTR